MGSKLLLKPSACHLAGIVTIVRPQQLFVSDSLSLCLPALPNPTTAICPQEGRGIREGWERAVAWESRHPKTSHPLAKPQFPQL